MGSTFEQHRAALFAAHAAGDHAAALRSADVAHVDCPDRHGETWYWRACLRSLMGRTADALAALEAGLAEGAWWSPSMLDGDTDLDSIRTQPRFAQVRAACEARWQAACASARPECSIISPATSLWEPRSLLLLHRWGGSSRESASCWQGLVDEGWTLVLPQSSQPCGQGRFCWDDRALAAQEVRQHLDDCMRKRALSMDGLVIGGASQAAPIAMDLACEAGLPWIAVIPSIPRDFELSRLLAVPGRTRGVMVFGELDSAGARTRSVAGMLQSGGVSVSVRSVPGVGHYLTAPMVRAAAEALRDLASPYG
jgi:predicted esterase